MANRDKNPLTPLNGVGPSDTEMEEMWLNIMQRVDSDPESSSTRRENPNRVRALPSIMAGVAAVVLVVGGVFAVHEHLLNQQTATEKHHVVSPNVNPTSVNQTPVNQTSPPSTVQNPSSIPLNHVTGIHMNDAQDGWVTQLKNGSTLQLLHTTDGGKTWQDVTPEVDKVGSVDVTKLNPNNQNELVTSFPSSNHAVLAWAVPRGTSGTQQVSDNILIETTTNGGKSWSLSEITDNISGQFGQRPVAFDFINDKDGWLTTMPKDGGGVMFIREALYRTTDGGVHWTKVSQTNLQKAGTLPSANASAEEGWVSFINPQVGFTLSEPPTQTDMLNATNPSLYRTTDGGTTWRAVNIPQFPQPFHVVMNRVLPPQAFGGEVILPVVTETANPGSYTLHVYVSHDKGSHFTEEKGTASMQQNTGNSMQYGFWDASHGWFFLGGTLYTTHDGGQTISKVKSNHVFSQTNPAISWLNQSTAIVAGESGAWKTTDGGQHWTQVGT